MRLFLLFLIVPLIEIALFVQIGGLIGLGWTLVTVVATAILGTWMVRSQGLRTLVQLRASLEGLGDPTGPLVHGAMILLSGVLLLTPGFLTDAIGFALLVPKLREAVYRYLRSKVVVTRAGPAQARKPQRAAPGVIEAEWEEVEPPRRPTHGTSGWTRH